MNVLILKKYLEIELVNYNYILGTKLFIYYLDKLMNKYSDDCELLDECKLFLQTTNIENICKQIKPQFNKISNPKIIIDLLRFFNPCVYGYFTNDCSNSSNIIQI
jgi:hypothetical protein